MLPPPSAAHPPLSAVLPPLPDATLRTPFDHVPRYHGRLCFCSAAFSSAPRPFLVFSLGLSFLPFRFRRLSLRFSGCSFLLSMIFLATVGGLWHGRTDGQFALLNYSLSQLRSPSGKLFHFVRQAPLRRGFSFRSRFPLALALRFVPQLHRDAPRVRGAGNRGLRQAPLQPQGHPRRGNERCGTPPRKPRRGGGPSVSGSAAADSRAAQQSACLLTLGRALEKHNNRMARVQQILACLCEAALEWSRLMTKGNFRTFKGEASCSMD